MDVPCYEIDLMLRDPEITMIEITGYGFSDEPSEQG